MYIDLRLNTPTDHLADLIEFCKQHNMHWNFDYGQNIPYILVKDKCYETIEYLLTTKHNEYYEKLIHQCLNKRAKHDRVNKEFADVLKYILSFELKHRETPIDVLVDVIMKYGIDFVKIILECINNNDPINLDIEDFINANNGMALTTAVRFGRTDVVALLIDHGAQISMCECDPINHALLTNSQKMVTYLLKNGSAIKNIDINIFTELLTDGSDKSVEYIVKLVGKGKLKNIKLYKHIELLVKECLLSTLKIVLDSGIDITNDIDKYIKLSKQNKITDMTKYLILIKNKGYDRANKLHFVK